MGGRNQSALRSSTRWAPSAEALGVEAAKRLAEFHGAVDTAKRRAKRAGNRFQDRIRGAFDGNGLTFACFVF